MTAINAGADLTATIEQLRRELAAAHVEQQRLTRELHHRVKNNLQIVSSLLALLARDADDPTLTESLAYIASRVDTLIRAHYWIHEDNMQRGVDLQALAADMGTALARSLQSDRHRRVRVRSRVDRAYINPDLAVPTSFLFTELAGLAARHGADGPLHIALAVVARDGQMTIAVASPAFVGTDHMQQRPDRPSARLIEGMVRQLGGRLEHDCNRGRYGVAFNI